MGIPPMQVYNMTCKTLARSPHVQNVLVVVIVIHRIMENLEEVEKLENSVLKAFDKVHNSTNESSEAEALELLSQLPNPAEVRDNDEDLFTLLHHACYNGWYEVAKVLIEKYNCDPNCRNAAGSIPLRLACWSGNLGLVKYLILDKGCDPNDVNSTGQVPLHNAALGGHLDVTKFLIEHCKVEPAIKDSDVLTPLHSACHSGHPAYKGNDGQTPLHFACERGHLNVAKYLIEEQHIDPSSKSADDQTPLHSACLMGHLGLAKYLIEKQKCNPACKGNDGQTPLHFACERGHLNVAKYLIDEQHIDLYSKSADGRTPLHSACLMGHLGLAKYLIEKQKCDPACKQNDGQTPLHFACERGHLNVAKYLIEEQHIDPSSKSADGRTPLHSACPMGHLGLAKYLIEKQKCDPACKRNDGQTPLHFACERGHLNVAKYLIEEQHIDPSSKSADGRTHLHSACLMEHLGLAKYLIEKQKCDPACKQYDGQTPLHFACERGHLNVAKYLIDEQHIDPYSKSADGRTPLHSACLMGHLGLAKYLIEKQKCDPACKQNDGQTPLHFACERGHLNVAKYLIEEQHIDPSSKSVDGRTPLHSACLMGHLGLAKYLIEKQKCDPACKGNDGQTPLHFACERGHLNVAKYLIEEQHIDPSSKSVDGQIPLYSACLMGHLGLAKYLIEKQKCDPACKRNDGQTPLHFACERGHRNVVKYLVEECNIDPSIETTDGRSSLHLACLKGQLNVTKYLIEEQQCYPACKKSSGQMLLHSACLGGHLHITKYLIEKHHISPSIIDNYLRQSPLHLACLNGHLDIANYLTKEQHCNPTCNDLFSVTPLHIACQNGHLNVVKFFVEKLRCDLNCVDYYGKTPLHSACEMGHLNVVKYLVEVCKCVLKYRTYNGSSPLSLACKSHQLDLVMYLVNECNCNLINSDILISSDFMKTDTDIAFFLISSCNVNNPNAGLKDLLLHPAFNVFVMGNFSSGKSTLVKAIQEHFQIQPNFAQKQIRHYQMVSGVELCTAGITSTDIQIPNCGRVIMYDFAGQAEYYSSHAAICESLITTEDCLIIVVFNLSKSLSECVQELQFWQLFINNQLRSCAHYPPIIFVASYADIVKLRGLDSAHEAKQVIRTSFGEKCHHEVVFLDCRQKYSTGLQIISEHIAKLCTKFQESSIVETKVHILLYFIRLHFKEEMACLLDEVFQLLALNREFSRNGQLPKSIHELSDLLTTLNASGELLLLKKDSDMGKSWVVFKKDRLFSEINGTIFVPEIFKNYHNISNSTGVIPLSYIKKLFPHYDPQMLVGFMIHLELCHEISKPEADLIKTEHSLPASGSTQGSEMFYFFPALVKVELLKNTFFKDNIDHKYGWCLQRFNQHQCLTSRFLHTLLLRLAFNFALRCELEVESIVIQRECNIWKNGIHWMNKDGAEVVVEVVEQSTAVVVVFGCTETNIIKCLKLRSDIIHMVLSTVEQFCGAVELKEYLIHPNELKSYPLKTIDNLLKYSIHRLALTIKEQTGLVVGKFGETFKNIAIDKLLYFEPYTCLSAKLIADIHSGDKKQSERISDNSLLGIAAVAYLKQSKLKEILPIKERDLAGAVSMCDDLQKADEYHQCFLLLRTWRDGNENATYNGLRNLLDSFSIFCGRNPLVRDIGLLISAISTMLDLSIDFSSCRILFQMFIVQCSHNVMDMKINHTIFTT